MRKDTVREPKKPEESCQDVLTEVLRRGAQKMLAVALEDEVERFLKQYAHLKDEDGNRVVVRCGHAPEREIQTGLGPMPVKAPRDG